MSAAAPAPGAVSTLRTQLLELVEALTSAGVASAAGDARWIVAHVAGRDPRRPSAPPLSGDELARARELVARRAAREPLQLVLGETAFRTLTLICRPGVFVPRPETEVVAGLAVDAARAAGPRPLVAEPCTGTGAIACSLAAEVTGVRVLAGDLDARAVALARHNAERLARGGAGAPRAAGATVEVRHGPLLDALPGSARGHLDVLVANPPYLPAADRPTWAPEVAGHDPHAALVGGADGHEIVDLLLEEARRWVRPGGVVVLEIDERRGGEAVARAAAAGLVDAALHADLTGAARAVVARVDGGHR